MIIETFCRLGAFSRFQFGDQRGNLLPGELVEFDNSSLLTKLRWHYMHRLISVGNFDNQPAAMCASFATPVRLCQQVRSVFLNCPKRSNTGIVVYEEYRKGRDGEEAQA